MNTHIYEAEVIRHEPYLQTVEAAMMQVALEVYTESPRPEGYANRADLAMAVYRSPEDAKRFTRFFAWLGLFNPTIRGQVFKGPGNITPADIDGEVLRTLIHNTWNDAANVQEGGGE